MEYLAHRTYRLSSIIEGTFLKDSINALIIFEKETPFFISYRYEVAQVIPQVDI